MQTGSFLRSFVRGASRPRTVNATPTVRYLIPHPYIFSAVRTFSDKQEEPQQEGFFSKLRNEQKHISDFMASRKGDPRLQTVVRRIEDVEGIDWSAAFKEHLEREKKAKANAEELRKQEGEEYEGTTDLMFVGKEETVWEQRIGNLREKLGGAARRNVRAIRRKMDTSENPLLVKVRDNIDDTIERVRDQVDDAAEAYETTQHPLVWKVRDATDSMFGETEEGWSMGQLKDVDPYFDMFTFTEEMQEYMIPIVIGGYLEANRALIELACEGGALRVVAASFKARETEGHYWDTRILDTHSVDVEKVVVHEDTPLIVLRFMCQHVKCHKDAGGDVVLGSEYNFVSTHYTWILRRDFESDYFNWKVLEMQTQEIMSLV